MFDIGFLEILVILIIALMVIGPARMPEVARKIGQFTGKTKRFINSMKEDSEISDAIREMKESINVEDEKKQLQEISSDLQEDMQTMHQEWGVDETLNRPNFGEVSESEVATGSQFNKAPSQPAMPKPEQPADTDLVENSTETVADNAEPAPQAESTKV